MTKIYLKNKKFKYLKPKKKDEYLFKNDIKNIFDDEIIVFHHLGLGDHIMCNGLVNYVSMKKKIHLVTVKKNYQNINKLYENNLNVSILTLPENFDYIHLSEIQEFLIDHAKKKDLKILKLGYDYWKKNLTYYDTPYWQLGLNYDEHSYKYFNLRIDKNILKKVSLNILEENNIENEFLLVHNESSQGVMDIPRLKQEKNVIYINSKTNDRGSIFNLLDLIYRAKEIHCINSSFLHVVDRVESQGKLFYHHNRASKTRLKKEWSLINY